MDAVLPLAWAAPRSPVKALAGGVGRHGLRVLHARQLEAERVPAPALSRDGAPARGRARAPRTVGPAPSRARGLPRYPVLFTAIALVAAASPRSDVDVTAPAPSSVEATGRRERARASSRPRGTPAPILLLLPSRPWAGAGHRARRARRRLGSRSSLSSRPRSSRWIAFFNGVLHPAIGGAAACASSSPTSARSCHPRPALRRVPARSRRSLLRAPRARALAERGRRGLVSAAVGGRLAPRPRPARGAPRGRRRQRRRAGAERPPRPRARALGPGPTGPGGAQGPTATQPPASERVIDAGENGEPLAPGTDVHEPHDLRPRDPAEADAVRPVQVIDRLSARFGNTLPVSTNGATSSSALTPNTCRSRPACAARRRRECGSGR
jgi:hypothetical protein